jgi:hypothetical protein
VLLLEPPDQLILDVLGLARVVAPPSDVVSRGDPDQSVVSVCAALEPPTEGPEQAARPSPSAPSTPAARTLRRLIVRLLMNADDMRFSLCWFIS